jgi:hypothetical protein
MSAARRPLLALCSLLLVAVSCSSPTDAPAPDAPPPPLAPVPARLLVVSGDWQEGTVGTELPFPLVAKVVDSVGVPVPNVVVAWEVTSAGGSISPASGSSDSLGTIHTHWTLGAVAATHAVEARVEGIPALSFSATAKAGIVLTVQQSVASTRDEDSVSLTVRVVSRYEIATVVASAENRQANLVPADGAWTGLLVLARGTTTIRVTATDVHGNAGTSIVGVLYSPKPSIIVASPEPYLVVRNGSVRASAACADGNPGCTIELYVGDTLQPNARGQSRVDVTIPLADRGDRPIRVQFRTRDSIERPVTMDRWIYVESSPSLREVASADGLVWDVDADRLLFLEYDGDPAHYPLSGQFSVNALKLRDRCRGDGDERARQAAALRIPDAARRNLCRLPLGRPPGIPARVARRIAGRARPPPPDRRVRLPGRARPVGDLDLGTQPLPSRPAPRHEHPGRHGRRLRAPRRHRQR